MAPKTREKDGQVWCPTCTTYLSPDDFHRNSEKRRVRAGSIYRWQCKSCESHTNKIRKLKHRYGITLEQKADMLEAQDNKCSVCKCDFTDTGDSRPHIDHCHDTGKVRDMLCNRCNRVLGWVEEDEQLCENLIAYIRKHK